MTDEKLITLELLSRYHGKMLDKVAEGTIWTGITAPTDAKYRYWIDESATPAVLKYKNSLGGWSVVAGGGGASTNNAEFNVKNTSGWLSKTVALGADCVVSVSWSSIEDDIPTGNGTCRITVGGTVRAAFEIPQGDRDIPIGSYLTIGTNSVIVSISDLYGNTRDISFTITSVKVSIDSYFDASVAYSGDITFLYTPTGAVEKTVHFLIDGKEVETKTVTASGREQTFTIPTQSHGSHTFKVYFTAEIDGQPVESNALYYDLICIEEGNSTPIIASNFDISAVKQFATVSIPYIVYDPALFSSNIELKENGNAIKTLTVDRTVQKWSYKAEIVGSVTLSIECGEVKKDFVLEVAENEVNVSAETSNLELYLTSKGRSNNEETPLVWAYNDIKAELTDFNLTNDGWQLDDNGDTVLRVSGDARVTIPFNIFESDFRTSGKTIEVEFATRDVLDYDSVLISSWCGEVGKERGLQITAQKALLKSAGSEIFTQYKENEQVRVAFTVDKKAENRLIRIYINGIMSGVVQYAEDDDFSQASPVGISIGSSECTTDIYCIRVYGNNLSQYQILDNWIADTQDVEQLIERYNRNNIFDDYGNVAVDKLPSTLPYMVLEASNYEYLPQYKGDKERPVNGKYVDPLHSERSFTFYQAQIDVQGTSSQYYSRKNYKLKFKNGFIVNGVTKSTYQLRETSMPTNVFTFKADVASSEGANNVELCKLYDDICPVKTPPQRNDKRVRQGIEGYPCLIFYNDGTNNYFLGKYNFNNDKGSPEVFGFNEGDESWEILQNNTDMVIWKDDDFSTDAWKKSFEARYPEDNTDVTNLQAFSTWIKSTDTDAVDTEEEKAERIAKFKSELSTYANVEMLIFNYIFTELFLMVDNRAKNAFPTRYDADGKWLILPYDYDTAIGINNEGELKFGYELEDTDLVNGNFVFNGQDSVLYVNLRLAFAEEIKEMYKTLRSQKVLSYDEVEKRFEEHQKAWGEAIFNEDARFKYIDPLIEEGNSTYLPMLQGSKAEQRKWWLYNRFRYIDSKYNAGDSLSDFIMLRGYGVSDIYIKPYADIYATVAFDSVPVSVRALRNMTPEEGFRIETPLSAGNGAVISIYSASQLASIGDLSGLKVGMADFSAGTKLNTLKVGDGAADYENPNLTNLTVGNLTLLTSLDVRNCTNLAQTVDVSGCTNLEHAYFEGTRITGVTLPNGGILKTLHLPSTVSSLVIRNQPLLTDFEMPSYENLTTLRLENLNVDLFDTLSMILQMPENSRVRVLGVEWTIDTAEGIFEVFDKLDDYRGLDEYGNNVDKPQISGVIHTGTITSNDYAEMIRRYPNFTINYEHITSNVQFFVEGQLVHSVLIYDNGDCYDPITENIINTPIKAESDTSKFIYNSWDNNLKNITTDTIVNAVFDEYKKYFVTFKDDRGTIVPINGNLTNIYYDRDGERVVAVPDALESYSKVIDGTTYDYHFEHWKNAETGEIGVVDVCGDDYSITYEAVFSEHRVNVVKFMNEDNTHSELHLYEGGLITLPDNPTKVSTAQYDFSFKGWSRDGVNLVDFPETVDNEDVTYYAVYDSILRYYTITFFDYDGKVLQSSLVAYGTTPFCEIPTREETAQYFYDFDGWTPKIEAVTGEASYMATYLATVRTYTVKWVNEDGSSLLEEDVNVPYGTMPSYDGATPTKPATAQYTYTFAGWHIDIETVTGHITYIATYTAEINKYTVTWKNADGTVLETDVKVPYGDMPEYNSATPTKVSTAQYEYIFAGWDTAVSEVTGDVVYKATYTEHIRSYDIKFVDYNGTVLSTQSIEYGSMPAIPTPSREGYDFTGWDKSVVAVEDNAIYTAQYKIKTFTIKFVDYNGTVLSSQTVEYGKTPTTPSDPSRTGYNFTGWSDTVTTAMANKTYTAQYSIIKYTITWIVGTETITTTAEYGSTPTPPYASGESFTMNGISYVISMWSPSIVAATGNATYNAKASGSVSARPTICSYNSNSSGGSIDFDNMNSFLAGTGSFYVQGGNIVYALLYGMNFNILEGLPNVTIESFTISIDAQRNGGVSSASTKASFNTATDLGTAYDDYKSLGDTSITMISATKSYSRQTKTYTQENLPNTLTWMNNNIDKVISGCSSNTFGLRFWASAIYVYGITMTLNFTFG